MKTLGQLGEWGAVWSVIGLGTAAVDSGRRRQWVVCAAAAPSAIWINYAVKVAVGRERPLIEGHPALSRSPTNLSFPSAHATSSLTAATAMGRLAPEARLPLLALAGAVCLSRPYLGMHYPSDVLAGVVLGRALGRAIPGLDQASLKRSPSAVEPKSQAV